MDLFPLWRADEEFGLKDQGKVGTPPELKQTEWKSKHISIRWSWQESDKVEKEISVSTRCAHSARLLFIFRSRDRIFLSYEWAAELDGQSDKKNLTHSKLNEQEKRRQL